jgi:hypothetical protein
MNHPRVGRTGIFFTFSVLLALLLTVSRSVNHVHAAAEVQIISHRGDFWRFGSISGTQFHVCGEVLNTGDQAVTSIYVTAHFYMANGSWVGTDSKYTSLSVLLPGRKTSFQVGGGFAQYRVQYIRNYTLSLSYEPTTSIPQALRIVSQGHVYPNPTIEFKIIGVVQNIGATTATHVKIVVTYYGGQNGTGGVVATGLTYSVPSDLSPNQTGTFENSALERSLEARSYALDVESDQYAAVPELPTAMLPAIMTVMLFSALLTRYMRRVDQSIKKTRAFQGP